jgi:hypothetical protein
MNVQKPKDIMGWVNTYSCVTRMINFDTFGNIIPVDSGAYEDVAIRINSVCFIYFLSAQRHLTLLETVLARLWNEESHQRHHLGYKCFPNSVHQISRVCEQRITYGSNTLRKGAMNLASMSKKGPFGLFSMESRRSDSSLLQLKIPFSNFISGPLV